MAESIGTYMYAVNEMGRASEHVTILLSVSLLFQVIQLVIFALLVYRVWRAWR